MQELINDYKIAKKNYVDTMFLRGKINQLVNNNAPIEEIYALESKIENSTEKYEEAKEKLDEAIRSNNLLNIVVELIRSKYV